MNSVEVPGPKQSVPLANDYVEAGLRFFPHGYPDYVPSPRDHVVIYICDECVRAQQVWKSQHPNWKGQPSQ
ncbi:MAG: hypothetical protein JWR19_753 [Pedosphaera sp.]|nr:hypothetical protein [Pedosphaera sp.]